MAEKKDYIALCRYYKGEEKNPFEDEQGVKIDPHSDDALLWFYEKRWVEMHMSESPILSDLVYDYTGVGLADFSIHDGVPLSLQALLFDRYCHTLYGASYEHVDDFKEWYKTYYLKVNG